MNASSTGTGSLDEVGSARPALGRGWLRALVFLPAWAFAIACFVVTIHGAVQLAAWWLELPGAFADDLLGGDIAGGNAAMTSLLLPQLATFMGSILAVYLFRRLVDGGPVRSLGFSGAGRLTHLALGVALGAVFMGLGFMVLFLGGFVEVASMGPGIDLLQLAAAVVLFALVAVEEELVMRGYILANLFDSMPSIVAVALSSILFAAAHMFNASLSVLGIVNIALAGAAFGVYYARFRSLWFPFGLHFAWNFFQGPVFGLAVSGLKTDSIMTSTVAGPSWLTGGDFGLEGSIIATGLEVAMIGGIVLWGRRSV